VIFKQLAYHKKCNLQEYRFEIDGLSSLSEIKTFIHQLISELESCDFTTLMDIRNENVADGVRNDIVKSLLRIASSKCDEDLVSSLFQIFLELTPLMGSKASTVQISKFYSSIYIDDQRLRPLSSKRFRGYKKQYLIVPEDSTDIVAIYAYISAIWFERVGVTYLGEYTELTTPTLYECVVRLDSEHSMFEVMLTTIIQEVCLNVFNDKVEKDTMVQSTENKVRSVVSGSTASRRSTSRTLQPASDVIRKSSYSTFASGRVLKEFVMKGKIYLVSYASTEEFLSACGVQPSKP